MDYGKIQDYKRRTQKKEGYIKNTETLNERLSGV